MRTTVFDEISQATKSQPGGWIRRYGLASTAPSSTEATLTYDWLAVPLSVREYITVLPFLIYRTNSLRRLAELVTRQ